MRTITEEHVAKLIAINELVKNEEVKAIARYEILQKELKEMLKRKDICDYNLGIKLSCFTSDETLKKKIIPKKEIRFMNGKLFMSFLSIEKKTQVRAKWIIYAEPF